MNAWTWFVLYLKALRPPEVPQWSEPMRYDVPQSNGCAGCPRLFVGTKWVGEICGAVYLGHNSVKYAERIVALWNDDIARHAPQPEAQPATETADEREANLSTEQVEQMLAESWKIIKNAEGNALPALPATGAAIGVERFIVNNNSVSTPGNGSYGSKKYLGAGTTLVLAADHDRLLAERDGEIVELKQKLADEERRGDLHADLNKRVAEAVGNPFSGPGSSWHDLPEKVAALRTRAEAAEAKCAEYRDTFTAANEMRLSGVRLRQAVQQRAELAEMRCTEALDRLEVANQQLAELLAANERMRAAMNDIDAYVRDIRHGATFADSMRDTIIITIRQALAAAETGVAK